MDIVWARDPNEGFVLGKITELLDDGAEVLPLDGKYPKRTCAFSDIHTAEPGDKDFDDNCELNLRKFISLTAKNFHSFF